MTTTGSWIARDACDREDCPMRQYQHRHRTDGTPEPAVADPEMHDGVARATDSAAGGALAAHLTHCAEVMRDRGSFLTGTEQTIIHAALAAAAGVLRSRRTAASSSEAATKGGNVGRELIDVEPAQRKLAEIREWLDELAAATPQEQGTTEALQRLRDRYDPDAEDMDFARAVAAAVVSPRQGTAEAATEGGDGGALGLRWRVGDLGEDRADRLASARWSAVGRDPGVPLRGEVRILHVGGQDDGREAAALAIVDALNAATPRAEGEAAAGELRVPEQQLEVLRRCLVRMGRDLLPGQTIASAIVDLIRLLTNGTASRALRTVNAARFDAGVETDAELADFIRTARAHRCAPPAPEVVSGAEAMELGVGSRFVMCDEDGIPREGYKVIDRMAMGPPHEARDLRWRVLHRVERPTPPEPALAVGDEVTTAAELDRLRCETVVRDVNSAVFERWGEPDGSPGRWAPVGGGTALVPALPVRVLDLPDGGGR